MYWKYGTTLRMKKPWYIGPDRVSAEGEVVFLKGYGSYVEIVTKANFLKKQDFLQGRKKLSLKYLRHVFGSSMCMIRPTQMYDPLLKEKGFEYLL
jgi:hypothetical protein